MSRHKISEVAKNIGVTAGTLRLWEQYGVLTSTRAPSGHRIYSGDQLKAAREIAQMRSTGGLSLAEIKSIIRAPSASHARAGTAIDPMSPGRTIRRMRLERKMSIQALADVLGVSASTISTFERTSRGAGVKFLRAVADYFGVTVTQLTAKPQPMEQGVVRRTEGQHIRALGDGIDVRALATGERLMDCKEWTLAPGAQSEGSYSHAGEEFVYVLSGTIELTIEGLGVIRLGPQDSLYFESTRNHSWINPADEPCALLWVNTPVSF